MSAEPATGPEIAGDGGDEPRAERPVEQRAEELVERATGEVARFARRMVARAREEVEDIVAEAQAIRRGDRRGG